MCCGQAYFLLSCSNAFSYTSGPRFRLVRYQDDASVLFLSGSMVQFFRSRMEKYRSEYPSLCAVWIPAAAGNTIFPALLGDLSDRAGSDCTDRIDSAYFSAGGGAEADDILNNFLGTMIGYGIYVLFREITAAAKRKRFSVLKMAAAQIPFAAIVLVFVGIFIMYDRQELGNLEIGLSSRIDMSDVQMTTTENYSSQPGTAAVYKIPVYTEEETRKIADNFFASLGQTLDESRTDLYDETAVYYSTEQNSLWIDYAGGTMSYTDYAVVLGTIRKQRLIRNLFPGKMRQLSEVRCPHMEFRCRRERCFRSSQMNRPICLAMSFRFPSKEMETGSMTDRCTARFMTEESWEISAIIFSHVRSIKIIRFCLKMKRGNRYKAEISVIPVRPAMK